VDSIIRSIYSSLYLSCEYVGFSKPVAYHLEFPVKLWKDRDNAPTRRLKQPHA